jgi:hypothetical protein
LSFTGFSRTDFPFNGTVSSITQPGQSGSKINVPCDGSVNTAITFGTPYTTLVVFVSADASTGAAFSTASISCNIVAGSVTLTGFSVFCSGGQPGDTCTVYWQAEGT